MTTFDERADAELARLRETGQHKRFASLSGPIGPVSIVDGREMIVLCSNDYLGLANHPEVIDAGIEGLRRFGAGTASVRFICGTLDAHAEVESAIAALVGTESALTFGSCWAANEALIATVATEGDTIISDALNHASIIDASRLARGAERVVVPHVDLDAMEKALATAEPSGVRWVVTDGVFSMEGDVAPLAGLSRLCREHGALLVVDDSHGVGVLGSTGRGTPEHADVLGDVDVLTGTLGKALGGAAGGYVAGSRRLIELLAQRARPSLFSNALPATVASSASKAIQILSAESHRVDRLHANVRRVREGLRALGFDCPEEPSAIIPIVLGDAQRATDAAARLREEGVLVVGFSYPVVPEGAARLRLQLSAAHEDAHLDAALAAFAHL